MAEMRKYRVETRTYNGNGYDYEDLAGVRFEAISGEDAIMQYKDYLKDQVASFSGLTEDEIEAEFERIDSMDCWSELAEEEVEDMKDDRGWDEYSDAELIKAIDDMVEFDADSMTELVKRADLYDQKSGILSRWNAEPDGEHDIQDFFDEACEIIKKFREV